MKSLKKILLLALILLALAAPASSLAESDYEEGDGWVYHNGELKVTKNDGLVKYIYHDEELINDSPDQQSPFKVDRVVIAQNVTSDIVIEYFIATNILSVTAIEEGNPSFIVDSGWIVNTTTKTLFGAANVPLKKALSSIDDLPDNIKHIGMYAFFRCSTLKKIVIPDGVVSIGESAFDGCDHLKTIALPKSATYIGISAFSDCTALTKIEFGTEVKTIDAAAFFACINLKCPNIYNTKIETVHGNSFWGCDQFDNIELPSTLKMVESQAFAHCELLNTLIFTSDQLAIEDGAFDHCENIRRLIFTKGKPAFIGNSLFGETEKTSDGKSFISYFWDPSGEAIPYPTLYYTAAYATEWSPNGETEWNGYPIQQISQDVLDAVIAQARGEAGQANTPVSTPAPAPTLAPVLAEASHTLSPLDGWMIAGIALAVIAAVVVVVGVVRGRRKGK